MQFKQVKNPAYSNAEQTKIDCLVEWSKFPGRLLPYTATADDTTAHGQDLYSRLIAGNFGTIADYSPPAA